MLLPTLDEVQAWLEAAPFHQWLGLRVTELTAKGHLVKPGSQIATAWSEVLDANGKQLAIGRGTFLASAPGVAP